jgi:hypothetical protein
MACEQVELASVPFTTFIANKKAGGESTSYSFVLRGYVQHWLNNVWSEYDRIQSERGNGGPDALLNHMCDVSPYQCGRALVIGSQKPFPAIHQLSLRLSVLAVR